MTGMGAGQSDENRTWYVGCLLGGDALSGTGLRRQGDTGTNTVPHWFLAGVPCCLVPGFNCIGQRYVYILDFQTSLWNQEAARFFFFSRKS